MAWIGDWVADKAAGLLKTGIQAGGNLAGNAVGSTGTLIETTGRGLGNGANGIAGAIGGVGGAINEYGDRIKESMAPSSKLSNGSIKTAAKTPAATKADKSVAKTAQRVHPPVRKAAPSTVVPPPPEPVARKSLGYTTRASSALPRDPQHELSSHGHNAKPSGRIEAVTTDQHKAQGDARAMQLPSSSMPRVGPVPSLSGPQKSSSGKVRISPASRPRSVRA